MMSTSSAKIFCRNIFVAENASTPLSSENISLIQDALGGKSKERPLAVPPSILC